MGREPKLRAMGAKRLASGSPLAADSSWLAAAFFRPYLYSYSLKRPSDSSVGLPASCKDPRW